MGNQAVFVDRDGVIIQEPPHYAHEISQLNFISQSAAAIRLLNENGFMVVVVSNQAGIARGYYSEEEAILFNHVMRERLAQEGARIDAIYYCPHHPQATIERYRVNCDCRKPKPGMLVRAMKELNIDLNRSFVVGDKLSDIETGKSAGCHTILVKTGYGEEELRNDRFAGDHIASNLFDAAKYILSAFQGSQEGS